MRDRETRDLNLQSERLRKLAFDVAEGKGLFINGDAIGALAEDTDPTAWRDWHDIRATSDTWFLWRNTDQPLDVHADTILTDDNGVVDGKGGCGLSYYGECQPCRFAPDVKAELDAMAAESEELASWWRP